jgi:hypothetical protein
MRHRTNAIATHATQNQRCRNTWDSLVHTTHIDPSYDKHRSDAIMLNTPSPSLAATRTYNDAQTEEQGEQVEQVEPRPHVIP